MEVKKYGKYKIVIHEEELENVIMTYINDLLENDELDEIISIGENGEESVLCSDSPEFEAALNDEWTDMTTNVEVTPNGEIIAIIEGDVEYDDEEEN